MYVNTRCAGPSFVRVRADGDWADCWDRDGPFWRKLGECSGIGAKSPDQSRKFSDHRAGPHHGLWTSFSGRYESGVPLELPGLNPDELRHRPAREPGESRYGTCKAVVCIRMVRRNGLDSTGEFRSRCTTGHSECGQPRLRLQLGKSICRHPLRLPEADIRQPEDFLPKIIAWG